jgi:hypothetical protein
MNRMISDALIFIFELPNINSYFINKIFISPGSNSTQIGK